MEWPQKERRKPVSSSFLFRVLTQLDDYVSVWNRSNEIVFANNRLIELWGLTREEVLGRTMAAMGIVTPASEYLLKQVECCFKDGKTLRGDFAFAQADGRTGYAEYVINPLFDDKHEVDLVACVARDVTEKKRIEDALHESEKQFRVLFEAIDQGLCVVELVDDGELPDLRHLFTNAAYRSQSGLGQVEGLLVSEMFPGLQEKWGETWLRIARSGQAERHKGYYPQLDRWLDTIIIPMEGAGSRRLAFLFSDITEQRNKERQLEEADRRKDEFLATLAHELRNPLAPIQSGIEVMHLALHDPGTLEDSLEMMERQMSHLVRLVDDLLDISRISRGKVTLRRRKLDLRDAIVKAMEATSTFIADRRVHVRYPPDPLWIDADPVRIVQVLGNLLSNAGKHTESQGRIWVEAREEDGQVRVSVRDDGAGMTPETLSRLFQLFMQVDSSRMGGLGIGLALVRKLVELHGGTVEAHSEGLGRGSEFILGLPGTTEGESSVEDYERPSVDLRGRRILVVDDNADAAASLALLLKLLGGEVRNANDGPTALREVESFAPQLVLLDLGMPGMDGFEVARRLRQRPRAADIRLVAVTGWGQEEDRRLTRELGFDAHLVKPISRDDLQRVLARLDHMERNAGQGGPE